MLNLTTFPMAFGPIGWQEMIILAILGVLIFGKRLPEVGRSIGKGIVEFKKGLSGIEDEAGPTVDTRQPPRIESQADGTHLKQETQSHSAASNSTSTGSSSGNGGNAPV